VRAVVISLTISVTASTSFAQQPVFRSVARVIPIATTVVDRQGRLVPRLERDAFTILDNGKPQEISFFQNTVRPFTVIAMLDNSASMTGKFRLLKGAAEEFLRQLLPGDRAQVGAFSDVVEFSGEFTNDTDSLVRALDRLPFGDRTRLYDAIDDSLARLQQIEGRKAVVVFTDGDDTASRADSGDLLERARRADVSVSVIRLAAEGDGGKEHRRGRDAMMRLAQETGGSYFALAVTDDIAPAFARIADELHSEYMLGFSPPTLDGREHSVIVRMNQPHLNARAKRSYVATAD
jgi:Ca-activated chloride channel family protein